MIASSRFGEWILSRRVILMRSRWQCPPFSCSSLASPIASSFVTHSHLATTLARVPLPTYHNFPSAIMYRVARCLALFLSLKPRSHWMSSNTSMTSRKSGVLVKRFHRSCIVGGIDTQFILYTSPALDSQSGSMSNLLPSVSDFGASSYCLLIPSAMFVIPGM
jgi:hypothetical protein